MKILKLTLHRFPFEVMETGEKIQEYRTDSKWIMSRLRNSDGTDKQYDYVEFTNGYGKNRPSFLCEYQGWHRHNIGTITKIYSNGLQVIVHDGDIVIDLGKVVNP